MSCVVLSGYYGFHNVGDEAILEATVGLLRRHLPNLEIVVLSADPAHTSRTYGVKAVQRTSLPAVLQALRRADLLISGGGGLLQDVTSGRTVPYYLGIIQLAMLLGTRVAVFAQGIGPLERKWSRRLVKAVLSRVDWLSVRDQSSAALLQEVGVRGEVVVAADPVFTLTPPSREDVQKALQERGLRPTAQRPLVGVSMRRLPREESHGTADFISMAREACLYLEREAGARLIFLPCRREDDLETGKAVFDALAPGHLIIEEDLPPREMLRLIGGLDLLLGMRLHALIFAAVCSVPFLGLPYDPKVSTFLQMMDDGTSSAPAALNSSRLQEQLAAALARQKVNSSCASVVRQQGETVQAAIEQLLALLRP